MKTKTLYLLSLLLFTFITLNAAETVKKEVRRIDSFKNINVGSAFVVYLSQGNKQAVTVETEDKYIDKIQTTVKNGTLHIELKNLKERNNRGPKTMNVYITIPEIKNVEATGAVQIKMQTPLKSKETVSFELSGASKLNDLILNCKKFELNLSGASKLSVDLTADEINANVSGASNLTVSGTVDVADIDASGASKVDVRNFTCNKGDFNSSGASKFQK